ncbi:MAG: TerC family protein, partial [Bacteroidales bacterium]|nr:TerC family protein [Bacteroidales bacterium]
MTSRFLFFGAFMVFIILMLAMDLGLFHKKDHVIKIKEAAIWTGIWVALAMLFGLLLLFKAEWVHGITNMDDLLEYVKGGSLAHKIVPGMDFGDALPIYRKEIFQQYLAGYFLEETLSIDNIFVMIMIFVSFGIDKQYYHRILFWGILGAIVMRFLFIFLLGAVIHKFSWVLAVFGVILIYSGIKMFRDKGDKRIDTANHPVVKLASRFLPVSRHTHGHDFFIKRDGRTYMTPLFLVLLVIEFSDVIFAVDSIPAVFS